MGRLRVAVIGVGNMGGTHARACSEIPQCKLVAVSDVSIERAKAVAERYNCKWYTSHKEMFKKEKLDMAIIAVPTSLHKNISLDALDHGLHILVEKPIAGTIKDAIEIINKSKEKSLKLAVGHIERFNPAVISLKKLIDDGDLGEVTTIYAKRVGVAPPQIIDTNIVVDVAIHDIEVINYIMGGSPDKIYANGGKAIKDNMEDFVEVLMVYGKSSGVLQCNWITPIKIRKLEVTGTKGYSELDYVTQQLVIYKIKKIPEMEKLENFAEVVKLSQPIKIEVAVKKEEPLKLELLDFMESIVKNKPPHVTGEQAIEALKIALNINQALKTKNS